MRSPLPGLRPGDGVKALDAPDLTGFDQVLLLPRSWSTERLT